MAEHHVLGLSGGKDSAALAIYMSLHRPELDIKYFFTDPDPAENISIKATVLVTLTCRLSPLASERSTASTAADQRCPSGDAKMAGSKFARR